MPQKVCPRCGSLYASLKSATCPQCFARLDTIDDEEAAALMARQVALAETPEHKELKEAEDEKFRHESFQACLGIAGITVLTVIAVVVIIAAGIVHRNHRRGGAGRTVPPISATPDVLTARPVENAGIEDVMPRDIGVFHLKSRDQQTPLSGTLHQVYHARYEDGSALLDVYAIAAERPVRELDRFRDAVGLLAGLGPGRPRQFLQFRTDHWQYGAIALKGQDADLDRFRNAVGAQFAK